MILICSFFLFTPTTLAVCFATGATVVYTNGIFTTKTQAQKDSDKLKTEYRNKTGDHSVKFINGYNPTHIGGVADVVHAAAQTLNSSISTFDRDTILLQIHPQVTTRRVVFVGHSQGAFYANELYDYVLAHGQPKAATGVYHVGTPASRVAGGGAYLTSSNDSIINAARALAASTITGLAPFAAADNLPERPVPLPANTTLSKTGNGHGLSGVYLAEAPERIVGDIRDTLSKLKPQAASDTGECFTAPPAGLGYQALKTGYAVADAAAAGVKVGFAGAHTLGTAVGDAFLSAAGGALALGNKVAEDVGITVRGASNLSKASSDEVRPTSFEIVSRLYGSSLSREDVAELMGKQGSPGAGANVANRPAPPPGGEVLGAEIGPIVAPAPKEFVGVQKITYLGGRKSRSRSPDTAKEQVPAPEAVSAPAPVESAAAAPEPTDEIESVITIDPATTTPAVATSTEPAATEPEAPTPPMVAERAVVINELMWAGDTQWIELYNASSDTADLSLFSLVVGDAAPVPLSGLIEPGQYVVFERATSSLHNVPSVVVVPFESLAAPVQVSLRLADGFVVDTTPAPGACVSWCAGGIPTTDFGAYADQNGRLPISMEREDAGTDGSSADNWASNDGYTKNGGDANNKKKNIIGTPGYPNSKHWPMIGFFCAGDTTVIEPRASAEPYAPASGSCTGLMGIVSFTYSAGGGIFKGEVGSSTLVRDLHFPGRTISWGNWKMVTVSFVPPAPGRYFVALWEYNSGVIGSTAKYVGDMRRYLLAGAQEDGTPITPQLAYHLIPFIIE